MKSMVVVGTLGVLLGVLLPTQALVSLAGPVSVELQADLEVGALLFRAGLVVLGLFTIALGRYYGTKPRHDRVSSTHSAGEEKWTPAEWMTVGGVTLLSLLLRLPGLDKGLWLDEILTYLEYARMPFGEIITTYASENQHFLFTLMAHTSFVLFGESALALRLPAVLFGVLSVGALYLLGRTLAGKREALVSSGLLAVSYHHIWFSQNARGYSGLLFWTILSSWFLVKGIDEDKPRFWVCYAFSAALGVYTHATMAFVIAGHLLIYCYTALRSKGTWASRLDGGVLGFVLGGLLTFQLHALVIPQVFSSVSRTESVVDAWKNPLWTALEILQGLQIGLAGTVAAMVALVLFAAGCLSYRRTRPILLALLLLPPLMGGTLVVSMGHHLWPRFFYFAMGFGVLVVVRGTLVAGRWVSDLLRIPPPAARLVPTALSIGLIVASALSVPRAYAPKQDYEGARTFVESEVKPGDEIVVVGLAAIPYRNLYGVNWKEVETLDALNETRSHAKRTWLLYTLRPVLESVTPDIAATIDSDFETVKSFPGSLNNGAIYVCRSRRSGTS